MKQHRMQRVTHSLLLYDMPITHALQNIEQDILTARRTWAACAGYNAIDTLAGWSHHGPTRAHDPQASLQITTRLGLRTYPARPNP